MSTSKIHVSVTEANDLEGASEEQIEVRDVFINLLKHPGQIIKRWNWKSATLGAVMRATFYFVVFKASRESWVVTITAVLVELGFRFLTSGISGALVQSFRKASPPWLAMAIISISLPIFGHTVEFVTHYVQEEYFSNIFAAAVNNSRQKAFAVSVFISVLSALFNIFMMRNGVMLVGAGEETKSLWGDFKSIPALLAEFVVFLPKQIIRFLANGKPHFAFGIVLIFGLIVGGILGTFRGKWSWAYWPAIGSWLILIGSTIIVALVMFLMKLRDRARRTPPANLSESKPPASLQ